MLQGFFRLFLTLLVASSLLPSAKAISCMEKLNSPASQAHASAFHHHDDSDKGHHHDEDTQSSSKMVADQEQEKHMHKHRHAPGEPEHSHDHSHPTALNTFDFQMGIVAARVDTSMLPAVPEKKFLPYVQEVVLDPILSRVFRPPIA